jgi:hypothetical protein
MTNSSAFSVAGVRVDIDYRDFLKYIRGLKAGLLHRGHPIEPERLPTGWELRSHHDNWPTGWAHYTDFWLSLWKKGSSTGEHVSIQPNTSGWRVIYNPQNSWTGGRTVHRELTLSEAIDAAIELIVEVDE